MYLVYCKTDGRIFREVENYRKTDEQLEAGMGGQYTLIYPNNINADVIEVTQEVIDSIDGKYDKYLIIDGTAVENPDYVEVLSIEEMSRIINDMMEEDTDAES